MSLSCYDKRNGQLILHSHFICFVCFPLTFPKYSHCHILHVHPVAADMSVDLTKIDLDYNVPSTDAHEVTSCLFSPDRKECQFAKIHAAPITNQ